ncbi:MAG TPA: DNA translocase FtsK, partial [Candidatus Paceibacterota bacterium]
RPSVEVITGLIKANITTRIALQVASQIDSRTIIDMSGAEKLLGKGDMLYLPSDSAKPKRVQGPYISEKEIKKVVDFLAKEYKDVDLEDVGPPGDLPAVEGGISGAKWQSKLDMKSLEEEESGNEDDDELYEAVREEVLKSKRASTSFVQRKFKLGYARAARIMDLLEERGVVGPGQGAKPREMLLDVSEGGSNFEKITELGEEERKL